MQTVKIVYTFIRDKRLGSSCCLLTRDGLVGRSLRRPTGTVYGSRCLAILNILSATKLIRLACLWKSLPNVFFIGLLLY